MRVTIELDDAAQAASVLQYLSGGAPPKSKKSGKSTKAATPEPQAVPELTSDDVRDAMKAHAEKHGRASAIALLEQLGVKAVSKLDPSRFEEAVRKARDEGPFGDDQEGGAEIF